ncbi:MAG: NAD-dependent epimerase/dehydratase family protein [Arachidicoccus sp.]|nr:NAD-dependent epimerase/dehydratase family protein [Arachidicoccus sp.]
MQPTQKQETIIITGASGLVGSHILQELYNSPARIIAVCRNIPPDADKRFEWIAGDILDTNFLEEICANADKIYHCAALVSYDPKKKKEIFQINVEGTANVVNAALNCGVHRLLYVSSVAAIGESQDNKMADEETVWKDVHVADYGKSKHYAEMEVWRGISEGLDSVIINPSIVLGCGDWEKGSTEIFKNIYKGFPWYSAGVHGFVDVRDVACAAVMLMNSDIQGQRFIINGINISYKELFSTIAQSFGIRPPYKKVTHFLSGIVWRLSSLKSFVTGKSSMITKHSARIAMQNIQFDNSKLLKFLPGFEYTDFKTSVQEICNCLKEKYNLL